MKDNKGINKGKEDNAKESKELKNIWKQLDEKLSGDKNINHPLNHPNENYPNRRLSDFKDILSEEYSKMEDRIKILETISKTLIDFMDDVYPQNHQSLLIKKILDKKDLMSLETVDNFLQLMLDEGVNSEAGKRVLELNYKGNKNRKAKKRKNLLELLRSEPELLKKRNWTAVVKSRYKEMFPEETVGSDLVYKCKKIIEEEIKK